VVSTEEVPTGEVLLSATFARAGAAMRTHGTLTPCIGDRAVGSAEIESSSREALVARFAALPCESG
jgi:hypothetical protein